MVGGVSRLRFHGIAGVFDGVVVGPTGREARVVDFEAMVVEGIPGNVAFA